MTGSAKARDDMLVIFAPGIRPPDLPPRFTWVKGDPTKDSELEKVRLSHASTVVIVGSRSGSPQDADARTILTAFTLRSWLGNDPTTATRRRPVYIIAEVLDAENIEHARSAGANEVIETTRLGFSLLAHAVTSPGTASVMGRLADPSEQNFYIGCPPVCLDLPCAFSEVAQYLKADLNALLIGLRHPSEGSEMLNPAASQPVTRQHQLIYMAKSDVLESI